YSEEKFPYFTELEYNIVTLSKTTQIGDDDTALKAFFGEPTPAPYDEDFHEYVIPESVISFITNDGKVKLISWGLSGSYEASVTKEGIGRHSSLNEAKEAYKDYDYKILYRKGLDWPSYMIIDYYGNNL